MAAADPRKCRPEVPAQVVDLTTDEVVGGRRRPAIGHVGYGHTNSGVEQCASEMCRGAEACRAELHLGAVRLQERHELGQIAGREVLSHLEHHRLLGKKRHRREVGNGIVAAPLVDALIIGVGADRAEQQRVAIRRRIHDPIDARDATGSGRILDHDGLSDQFAHPRSKDAADGVEGAAGREWNDHDDGLGGIGLRQRGAGARGYKADHRGQTEQDARHSSLLYHSEPTNMPLGSPAVYSPALVTP